MKTLYILRHGQAEPETMEVADHERQLTLRGQREATRAGEHLLKREPLPTLVVASSAARARATAELALGALPASSAQLRVSSDLYLAEPDAYLIQLAEHGDTQESVMVVGHNPGLEALVHLLTDRSEALGTGALVQLELSIATWDDLTSAARRVGRLVDAFRA